MEKQMVKKLMFEKVEQCAKNDVLIAPNTDTYEEYVFYSDTDRVFKELTYKYGFTEEEVSEFGRYYDSVVAKELFKHSHK